MDTSASTRTRVKLMLARYASRTTRTVLPAGRSVAVWVGSSAKKSTIKPKQCGNGESNGEYNGDSLYS
eukprot:scaffold387092_cov14-Prasinocladus_malaysianus.AAC.1